MNRNTIGWICFVTFAAVALVAAPYLSRRLGLVHDVVTPDPLKGRSAPDFALEALDGKMIRLSDLRGKAVLLNFWATWCVPCKTEMPWFEDFQKQYREQGLQVLGVDTLDSSSRDEIAEFARRVGVSYPIMVATDHLTSSYGGVRFLPSTVYIDREGRVVDKSYGLKSKAEIENEIKLALTSSRLAQRKELPAQSPKPDAAENTSSYLAGHGGSGLISR